MVISGEWSKRTGDSSTYLNHNQRYEQPQISANLHERYFELKLELFSTKTLSNSSSINTFKKPFLSSSIDSIAIS